MINVTPYLKDIDNEMAHLRHQMKEIRARLTELEDMRVLMMQREETRAAINGYASPFGALPNGVEIAVRAQMDEGVLSQAAKTGALPPPTHRSEYERSEARKASKKAYNERYRAQKAAEAAGGGTRKVRSDAGKRKHNEPGLHRKHWDPIEKLLKSNPHSQFDVDAIIDRLGIGPLHGKDRQPIYQVLYEMNRQGMVERPMMGTYKVSKVIAEHLSPQ